MPPLRTALRWLLAAIMTAAGVLHFVRPEGFVRIVPAALPWPLGLVLVSGFFEIVGGLGLVVPPRASTGVRRWASYGLVALYLAVFPANVNMAVNHLSFGDGPTPAWVLWGRLPLQALLIAWALYVGRSDRMPPPRVS